VSTPPAGNSIFRDHHEEVSADELEAPNEQVVCNERKDRGQGSQSTSKDTFTHQCQPPVLGQEGNPNGVRDVRWFLVESPTDAAAVVTKNLHKSVVRVPLYDTELMISLRQKKPTVNL